MNNNSFIQKSLLVWQKDYRAFMQGLRCCLGLLFVVIIYYFVREPEFLFMGICVIALTLACVRSLYWRFEFNLIIAYILSTAGIFISYPYTTSTILINIYVFFLTFFIYVFLYYKIQSIYSLWISLIPMYTVLFAKNYHDIIQHAKMNTYSFLICVLICGIFFRPRLRKECIYEIRSILRELSLYIEIVEQFTFQKSDKASSLLTLRKEEIFLRLQNLRLMMSEINFHYKKSRSNKKNYLFSLFIIATLTERFIETTVGISIKIRMLNITLEYEPVVRSIFNLLNKTNASLLKFFVTRDSYSMEDLSYLYEKLYLDALIEFKKIEKTSKIYLNEESFNEIFSSAFQLKENIILLNAEFKTLRKKELIN